jgi:hypothetical protein
MKAVHVRAVFALSFLRLSALFGRGQTAVAADCSGDFERVGEDESFGVAPAEIDRTADMRKRAAMTGHGFLLTPAPSQSEGVRRRRIRLKAQDACV